VIVWVAAKQDGFKCSSDGLERFAFALANNISKIAAAYEVPAADSDPETFLCNLYRETLDAILKDGFTELGDIFV